MAPLAMTISVPQQTLLYTPKRSFNWPVFGTVCDTSEITRIVRAVFACIHRTNADEKHSARLVGGIALPLGEKSAFHPAKNVRRGRCICRKCPSYRSDANGSGFARIVMTQQQNPLGYDNEVRLTRPDKGT